jgi:hypothetical protein
MKTGKIERTSRGLADVMFEELEKLRDGDSTPQHARAAASLANTICSMSRLEMDFARFAADPRLEDGALKAISMGQ